LGTVSGGKVYELNAIATIEATANDGYRFVRWNDGNTTNPRSVTVTEDKTFVAEFVPKDKLVITVEVVAGCEEMGTVTGGGSYELDETATITATANAGYRFVRWNDGNTTNPRPVTVTEDKTFTAEFAPIEYRITVIPNDANMGTVTGGGEYQYNQTATLKSTANAGYRFVRWNDGNTDNPHTVTVREDKIYIAEFAPNDKYLISVEVSSTSTGMGIVSGGGNYAPGAKATIMATASAGNRFVRWNDGNTATSRTVTVTADKTYIAEFVPIGRYRISVKVSATSVDMGTVSGGGIYAPDATATITATANDGYNFVRWNDGSTETSRTFTVTEDKAYTAEFVPDGLYRISVELAEGCEEMGTVSGGGVYVSGVTAIITATANAGHRFVRWNGGNTDASRTVTVTGDKAYIAEFAPDDWYRISVEVAAASEGMGTVSGSGNYALNARVTIAATANTGYNFVKWDDGDRNISRSVNVTADKVYTAEFIPIEYRINAVSDDPSMGSVEGGGTYKYNETATLKPVATPGYRFVRWNDDNTDDPRIFTVTKDEDFTAIFEVIDYNIYVDIITPIACYGGEGEIQVTVTGETSPYLYWLDDGEPQTGDGNFTLTVPAGTYSITVKDKYDREKSTDIQVPQPDAITAEYRITPASCNGSTDGEIIVENVTGGDSPYTYSFDGGDSYDSRNNITGVGDYNIRIKDSKDCESPIAVETIDEPKVITATLCVMPASCNGSTDGSITVSDVIGGTPDYQFRIKDHPDYSDYQADKTFNNLTVGKYEIITKDGNDCESSPVEIAVPESSALSAILSVTPVSCRGKSNGSITVLGVNGGTPKYQYSIDGGNTYRDGETFGNLSAKNYNFILRDANGCKSSTVPVKVIEPQVLTVSDIRVEVCSDRNNINLSKYVDTVELLKLTWSGNLPIDESTGIIPSIPSTAPTTYTFQYTASNFCTTLKANLYLQTVNDRMPFTPPDTIAICYEQAEALQINQIIGIDVEGGEWYTAPVLSDTYARLSPADSPFAGAFVFYGKKAYLDEVLLPTIPYHGIPAHMVDFYYSTPDDSCMGGKVYKTVIVLTPSEY
jgi:hypothetical protein